MRSDMENKHAALHCPKRGFVRRERKLPPSVIVHCCAGWGKSVFLAQLERDLSEKAAAFSLEGARGAEDVTALLRTAAERLTGKEFDDSFDVSDFIRLAEERQWVILADDLDRARASVGIIRRLIMSASENGFRFVGACRRVPGGLLNAFPDGDCAEMTARELAFTDEETLQMLGLYGAGKIPVTMETAAALARYTGGFPAAQLFMLDRTENSDTIALAADARLKRYIESNILGELDAGLSSYLKRAALLEEYGVDLGESLSHSAADGCAIDPSELFSDGIIAKSGEKYALTPVMRQTLSGMLTAGERRKLFVETVKGFIESNGISEAIAMLDKCKDASAVESVLLNCGAKLLENCEFELIGYCADILDRLGKPARAETLGILAQYYYYKGDFSRMEGCYNRADSMFGKDNIYSACRKLYNGLLRYEKNRALYSRNVIDAEKFLRENNAPLPFLYGVERERLDRILRGGAKSDGSLCVRRFGRFSVTSSVNGYELQWRTKKAYELMAYMLENGGKPVSRDKLINVLWPYEVPNNAVAMLHNIIYSIRKELSAAGTDNFIQYAHKYYSLDMSQIKDEDKDIFHICDAYTGGSMSEVIERRDTLRGYWGEYLEGIDRDWANNLREHYDKCFVDVSLTLAEYYHEQGDYTSELSVLNNAAALDPYSEKIVRDILFCYVAQGRPNKAKEKYESFSEFIGNELGITPGKWLRGEFLSCFSEE